MKRRILARTMLAALLFAAIPISAVDGVAATTPAPSSLSAQAQTTRLHNLQTRGTAEIDRRVSNLNSALAKLGASTKLKTADKSALTQQVQTEVASLTALENKLVADTDLATARTDVQSIVTDYRVYVLMLPKVRLVASTDRFDVVEDKLATLNDTLQTKVNAAKSAGKDVTALQSSLDDMKAKTADATSKTSTLVAQLLALQPTDYNANHAVLLTYRTSLTAALADVKAARDDAKSVIDGLK